MIPQHFYQNFHQTRMHSSRMHTTHLLTVPRNIPCVSGGLPNPSPGGRPPWIETPTPWMQTPWMQTPLDADPPGCKLSWRQTPPLEADSMSHVNFDACWEANLPPHVNRMTHRCKNITFNQLHLRAVIIGFHFKVVAFIYAARTIFCSGRSRILLRGMPTPEVGVSNLFFCKFFPRKLHENETIFTLHGTLHFF